MSSMQDVVAVLVQTTQPLGLTSLSQDGDLSTMYPASCPVTAGISSSTPLNINRIVALDGWKMDGSTFYFSCVSSSVGGGGRCSLALLSKVNINCISTVNVFIDLRNIYRERLCCNRVKKINTLKIR